MFLIERNFALEIAPDAERTAKVVRINDEIGVRWLYSFLSADKRKTYCLYEAPNAEAIRAAADKASVPADVIIEVSEVRPGEFATAR